MLPSSVTSHVTFSGGVLQSVVAAATLSAAGPQPTFSTSMSRPSWATRTACTAVTCSGIVSEKHLIAPGRNFVGVDLKAENQNDNLIGLSQVEVVFQD